MRHPLVQSVCSVTLCTMQEGRVGPHLAHRDGILHMLSRVALDLQMDVAKDTSVQCTRGSQSVDLHGVGLGR
jgi:hypothetical protein